jgi:hypothetical protein
MAHNSVYGPPVVVLALKAGFCAKAAAAGGELGVSLALISPNKGAFFHRAPPPPLPLATWKVPLPPPPNKPQQPRRPQPPANGRKWAPLMARRQLPAPKPKMASPQPTLRAPFRGFPLADLAQNLSQERFMAPSVRLAQRAPQPITPGIELPGPIASFELFPIVNLRSTVLICIYIYICMNIYIYMLHMLCAHIYIYIYVHIY